MNQPRVKSQAAHGPAGTTATSPPATGKTQHFMGGWGLGFCLRGPQPQFLWAPLSPKGAVGGTSFLSQSTP